MKRVSLLALLVFSVVFCASARPCRSFYLRRFTPPEAISSTLVRSVVQDSRGYVWIGGNNGLDRYDGYQLRHISMPEDCRGYDNVYYLCEDNCGRMWIGSFNGICTYDYATDKIRKYSEGAISCMLKSKDGKIWVAGDYGGFYRIDPATEKCDSLTYEYGNPSEHFGSGLCYDGDERVYFINGTGTIYRTETLSDKDLKVELDAENSPFRGLHVPMFYYSDGYIVGGAPHHTVFYNVFDKSDRETPWSTVEGFAKFDGRNILATRTGIYVLDSSMNLIESFESRNGLPKGVIPSAMCVDAQGGIWLGTTYSGVYRMMPNRCDMTDIDLGASPCSILEDPLGNIWINTLQDGLKRYSRDGVVSSISIPADTKEMLSSYIIGTEVLVGYHSINSSLIAVNWMNGTTRPVKCAPATMHACLDMGDGCFIEGPQGRPGIVDTRNGTFTRFETVRTTVSSIIRDIYGNIWYSTNSTGLWMQKDSSWTHYTKESAGIAMQIKSLYSDDEGVIWLSTLNNGIQRFNPGNGELLEITDFGGTTVTEVRKIVEDSEGTLWAATPQGLATVNKRTLSTSLYTSDDGLEFDDYGLITLMYSSDGQLYVANKSGLFAFDPIKYRTTASNATRIIVTGISVLGSIQRPGHDVFPERKGESYRLSLRYKDNSFRIHASQMNYSFPGKYDLVYRVDEFGRDWHPMDNGTLTITNLSPGRYSLRIGLKDISGNIGNDEIIVRVIVRRPLMASWPMVSVYLLVAVFLIFLIVRMAKKKAVKRAKEDAERSMYDSKMRFLTNLAHEIRTPLALVRAPVDAMRERVSKNSDAFLKHYFDIVSRNTERLSVLLEELLDMNKFDLDLKDLPSPEYAETLEADVSDRELDVPEDLPTIMVVDDNEDMRNFLSNDLSLYYNVVAVSNGQNALRVLNGKKYSLPSLILSDVMMPRMDGYELCREIRNNPDYNFLPVVLLTARGDAASRVLGLDYGADAFISKPFDIDELHRTIARVLENRELVKAHYMTCRPDVVKSEADSDFLRKLDKYVRQSVGDPSLNVSTLAGYMCMSESTLFKKMKATLGVGPKEYILKIRMKKAASLLRTGKMSVGDVAANVGFNSVAYFSNCFKKEYGLAPKAYSSK